MRASVRIKSWMDLLSRATATLFVATLGLCAPAVAGQAVHFEDGRVLEVAEVERRGETILLSLEGGGVISVPAWRVTGWDDLPPPPVRPAPRSGTAWRREAGVFAEHIERAAREHRLDPALLTAVARTESAFDPDAVSPKGASGLMQLMPHTAKRFGVSDIFDVSQNVNGGARYLSWLMRRFEGRTDLALAGYNAGEAAVERYNGIPPYPETEDYVVKVLHETARLTGKDRSTALARRDVEQTGARSGAVAE